MSGPFNEYTWGPAYERMHATMHAMRERDPSPRVARDEQLAVMWDRAYENYQATLRASEMNTAVVTRLQERLAAARETEDRVAETELMERLAGLDEASTAAAAAVDSRLQGEAEWLEELDAEYARRPWLCGSRPVDPWAIDPE